LVACISGLVLFGGSGVLQLRSERADLRNAIEREVGLLGRSLRASVENALRDRQWKDVNATLERLEPIDPRLDIFVYDEQGKLRGYSPGAAVPHRPALPPTRESVHFEPAGGFERAVFETPLTSENGASLGAIVMVRPLDDAQRDLGRTQLAIVVTMLLFVLCTTASTFVAAETGVGRPIGRLIAAMQRFRAGEVVHVDPGVLDDEIRALEAEFNRMEDELRAAQDGLRNEAEQRRQLQQVLQRVDKLATVGQLAAGLAHEIGSPLQVIQGRAAMLREQPGDAERTRRHAEILVEQTERINRIVRQLLTYARRRPPQRAMVDAVAAARAVVELLEFEAKRRGVTVRLDASPHVPAIRADHDGIQQVVLNLVSNALAATAAGGHIQVSVAPTALSNPGEGTTVPGLRITVEDTGHGVESSMAEQLFEPFFTTHADTGGTGLGLAVVKSIVSDHGGTIAVDPQRRTGARFVVELPASPPDTAGADHAA
jgi:signal transduction histidine kinase